MSSAPDLVIRARRAVLPDGTRPASVRITGGVITELTGLTDEIFNAADVVDLAADEVLLPGLVDTHVHVNEPGRTDWEGFATATRAAAAGGVTTILDMPLNSLPPTIDVAALAAKRAAAAGQIAVDVGFWGGAVPGSAGELPGLHRDGVFGFKVFLADSGVPEFPPLDRPGLDEVMARAAELDSLVIVHAEDAATLATAALAATGTPDAPRNNRFDEAGTAGGAGAGGYRAFLRSRPAAAEVIAVDAVIGAARRSGARAHVLHLSAGAAVGALARARRDGVAVTAETCPHYLVLAAEDVPDGATEFKCCPPVRERVNADLLWQALADGIIDCVVSDHSPCPPALKRRDLGDFAVAWGGISSLQLTLPVVWTRARARGFALDDVARWMAARPAQVAGLAGKGQIAAGFDADLVAFAPSERFLVEPGMIRHRHRLTPYAGQWLDGVVRRTWLRGGPPGAGRLLARGQR